MSIQNFIEEEQFFHHFQPIYHLNSWGKFGYEVLLRSKYYKNPEATFFEAKKEKQLYELDSRSIHKAILTYRSAGLTRNDGYLFLNVFPSTILNENFPSFIGSIISNNQDNSQGEKTPVLRQQIVLELSETEIIEDIHVFKERINTLKAQGILIAIDDIGKGYSNFETIIELGPNFLKFDRYFGYNLSESKQKQSMITLFLNYCQNYQAQLIIEGIESERDLAVAKALEIDYAQGFILGKPDLLKQVSNGGEQYCTF